MESLRKKLQNSSELDRYLVAVRHAIRNEEFEFKKKDLTSLRKAISLSEKGMILSRIIKREVKNG